MEPNESSPTPPPASRFTRTATRTTGLVALAGLAAGGAFAAVSGISDASSSTPSTSTTATSATPNPTAGTTWPGTNHGGGFDGDRGFGGGGFGGGGGTITAINGSTVTLRTEQSTETVKTTSKTTYTKERVATSFAQLHVGDVVRVDAPRPTSATATPGTGTVTATGIDVVQPELTGRVTKIEAGTYTLVGRNGQLETVSTAGSTRYFDGSTKTTAASVKVGSYVVAEGSQDSLTHLSADVVGLLPKPAPGAHGGGFPGRFGPR